MRSVDVHTALDMPHLPEDARLRAVLASALGKLPAPQPVAEGAPLWPAAFFGLDGVAAFRDADVATAARVVHRCGLAQLEEAWFIEQSGLAFTAQMSLLAKSVEERQLYALFAADEACHLALVGAFLPPGHSPRPSAFHDLLCEVIETADRATLIFVIQVVLEGWGLTHYRALADAAVNPELKAVFERILRDEARHHGSGLLLFDEAAAQTDVSVAVGLLERFLGMVRAGPVTVMGILQDEIGPTDEALTRAELRAEDQVRDRLAVLRRLIDRPSAAAILRGLDAAGSFA